MLIPIRERKDIMGFLKACWNIGFISHQAGVNAFEDYSVQKQAKRPGYQKREFRAPHNHALSRPPPLP